MVKTSITNKSYLVIKTYKNAYTKHNTQKVMMMIMMMPGEKQYKFEEILPIYKAVNSETDVGTFADFMEAFKTFDREGQGYIAAAELRHVLTSLGKQPVSSTPQICINTHPDAVPPIHAVSYHVATDKPPRPRWRQVPVYF